MNKETLPLMEKWQMSSQKKFRPLQASLELTNRCNERCTHCYIPEYKDDTTRLLTLEQWKKILQQLREAGVLYLILMGGEAMLSPHFWGIAEEGYRLGFSLAMITNGLLIDETSAQRLADTGFADITISLYSLNPRIHDSMTKVYGSCLRTQKAIELCQKKNLRVGINCLLTEANIDGYFELYDWCQERNLQIRFDPIVTPKFGGDLSPTKKRARPDQIFKFYRQLYERFFVENSTMAGDLSDEYVCNAGKGKCAITAYGDLLACIDIREPLGNLSKENFSEIWDNFVAQKWRSIRHKDLVYSDSGIKSSCEHCPAMAFHEMKDPYKVTDYETLVARAKLEAMAYVRKLRGGKDEIREKENPQQKQKEIPTAPTSL